ncbi:NAD(P)-bd_dom domain-containing protein [Psidium guajava]|nr:NAD(P)-bd_dom domain-containing protein [Psidium guajava]
MRNFQIPVLAILPMSRTISNSYKRMACTTVVITIEDTELIAPGATMEIGKWSQCTFSFH